MRSWPCKVIQKLIRVSDRYSRNRGLNRNVSALYGKTDAVKHGVVPMCSIVHAGLFGRYPV